MAKSLSERFWSKVAQVGNVCECWLWLAYIRPDGYGEIRVIDRAQLAHRVSYVMCVGEIPDGLQLDHLCRDRSCINPFHLEPVTTQENTARGEAGKYLKDKTHCKSGHEFTPENTFIRGDGGRFCRECGRRRTMAYLQKKKDNAARSLVGT